MPLGPFVGAVTPTSVKIWFRPDEEGTCSVQLSTDQNFGDIIAEQEQVPDDAGLCLFSLDSLEPNQRYFHRIDRAGTVLGQPGSFRTFPQERRPADFTFALYSCDRPFAQRCWLGPVRVPDLFKHWATHTDEVPRENADVIWNRFGELLRQSRESPEKEIRFLLAVGDQIYCDRLWDDRQTWQFLSDPRTDPEERFRAYREVYERIWSREASSQIWRNLPTFRIWDDHEIRDGWGSHDDQGEPAVQNMFRAAVKAYHAYQDSMNPSPIQTGEWYYSFAFGTACFLVLDLRGRRDRARRPYPLLGAQQLEDIQAFVDQFPDRYQALFVVSSVPMVHATKWLADAGEKWFLRLAGLYDDLGDQWSARHNAPEALRLLDLLFDLANRKGVRVALLGGDAHVGTVAVVRSYRRKHERHPLIYQLTSSPISNAPAPIFQKVAQILGREVNLGEHSPFAGRLLKVEPEKNVGLIHVSDGSREDLGIVFELILESGRRLRFPTVW